jgi:1,4-alpha-glucan branching enzyme
VYSLLTVHVAVITAATLLQGYLPRDLYQLDSCYGSESELRELIQVCHQHNIKVIADIVVNHRCVGMKQC